MSFLSAAAPLRFLPCPLIRLPLEHHPQAGGQAKPLNPLSSTCAWTRSYLGVQPAMNFARCRTCRHCLHAFLPDFRNSYHQRFCSEPECQQASKQVSQQRWLRKPENRDYFCGPSAVVRVQAWRRAHPGYWRSAHHRCNQLATPVPQPSTLQEFCRSRIPVLIELITRLGRVELQEDIARCATQMLREAQCILLHCQTSVSANLQAGCARICDDTS